MFVILVTCNKVVNCSGVATRTCCFLGRVYLGGVSIGGPTMETRKINRFIIFQFELDYSLFGAPWKQLIDDVEAKI